MSQQYVIKKTNVRLGNY